MSEHADYRSEAEDYAARCPAEPATGDDIIGAEGALVISIPAAKYPAGKTATAKDADLVAGNIKNGVTIFGVAGNFIGENWLTGWKKRISLTIDHRKIDAALSHFPVMVVLSATQGGGVFDELADNANRFKIAFSKENGTTELYGEIEYWDDASETAIIHVSRSGWKISSIVDTIFYMYYDADKEDNNTYIGDIGSAPGQSVWDNEFMMVFHMADATTSSVKDSTGYGNNGTKTGVNSPAEAITELGKGQTFNGDNYIDLPDTPSLDIEGNLTIEGVFLFGVSQHNKMIAARWGGEEKQYLLGIYPQNKISMVIFDGGNKAAVSAGTYDDGARHYHAGRFNGANVLLRTDEETDATGDATIGPVVSTEQGVRLGNYTDQTIGGFVGTQYEVRISAISRAGAWLKATRNTLWDALVVYGAEEE